MLFPAADGSGEMVCVPISTEDPLRTWEGDTGFGLEKTLVGPVESLQHPVFIQAPIVRKVNSQGGSIGGGMTMPTVSIPNP